MTTELATAEQSVEQIMGGALPAIEDGEQAQRAIVERIMLAESIDDVWQDSTTTATRDLVGRPIRVYNARLMRSNIEGTRGVYMLLDVELLDTKERLVVNTGAPNIMAIIFRRMQLDGLPVECEVIEVGRAKPGLNPPLGLRAAGADLKRLEKAKSGK